MEKAGNRHLLTVLTYPGAGHLIEPPYTPHFRASNFILQEMKEKSKHAWTTVSFPFCIGSIYLDLLKCAVVCACTCLNTHWMCCCCCCSCHAVGWTGKTARIRTGGRMGEDFSISAAAPLLQFKLSSKSQTVVVSFTTIQLYFKCWSWLPALVTYHLFVGNKSGQ